MWKHIDSSGFFRFGMDEGKLYFQTEIQGWNKHTFWFRRRRNPEELVAIRLYVEKTNNNDCNGDIVITYYYEEAHANLVIRRLVKTETARIVQHVAEIIN